MMAKGLPSWASRCRQALVVAGAAALIGGCAHLPNPFAPEQKNAPAPAAPPAPAVSEPPQEQPAPAAPRRPARRTKPPVQTAMIDPNSLVGLKRPDVVRLLGMPTRVAKDELSLIWTYAVEGCALQVYFYPDLKTADFHVLKYTLADADGKALDADTPCRRKLLAIRENDTG